MSAPGSAPMETLVAASAEEQAALGAELIARAIHEAILERGVARIALSGGSTPRLAYEHLGRQRLDWPRTEWFWVDERAGAKDSDRSNYAHAYAELGLADKPGARVHRMEADLPDLGDAAARYEATLRRSFGVAAAVAFDVLTLGIGDDGHTASLFPGLPTVAVEDRLVASVPAQPHKGLEARLTLTAPVIREARLAVVLCRGAAKRPVIELARSPGPLAEVPSRLISAVRGRVVWLLDEAAAGG